jgi:hypothetical protein
MMEEEHYADFAIMFRLLHSSRMPAKMDQGAESLIEKYHQDALDSGSRIREGLSNAVEISIRSLANGFLQHADNEELREQIDKEEISASKFYQYQLRLIYRLLFLMVIEERNLIFPANADKTKREIYYQYYSVNHLRKLCEKLYLADQRFNDLWIALKNTFHLFESEIKGKHLGLSPLAGDLFGYKAIGTLNNCNLDNKILLECLRNLSVFINNKTGQKMRVNYASLNVEEFGSVYEGMLEYDPVITKQAGVYQFDFVKGSGRSSSGSHYTPDELVQPLIKHSLDYVIEDRLKSSDKISEKEKALLSINVCDVACGSGHILLNAARKIGAELAKVRTGEDQPSPAPLRQAIRDVIKSCIYGVDKNPLAVELCKVALWLEAHNPGEPLNFLDHHIKCGDAIVGLAHKEELENGIADEAFKKMPGDDKEIRAELAKRNKRERKAKKQHHFDFGKTVESSFADISIMFDRFNRLPENTIEEIEHKRKVYVKMTSGAKWLRLKTLADIQVALFFIPKDETNVRKIVTDEEYMDYLSGTKAIHPMKAGKAGGIAGKKRFFHWFLEFPEVFAGGGFDCILGNPPYLGGKKISGANGDEYLTWLKYYFLPSGGLTDLVVYFHRRDFSIIKQSGFYSLISTNSISEGDSRENGLEQINLAGGQIIFAEKATKWPGVANLSVTLSSVIKGEYAKRKILDNKIVEHISSFLDERRSGEKPKTITQNLNRCFQGSVVLGTGYILSKKESSNIKKQIKYRSVIFPYLSGNDLNNNEFQKPTRDIINFFNWSEEEAKKYELCYNILKERVKPQRDKVKRKLYRENWWQYAEKNPKLYNTIKPLQSVIVTCRVTKHLSFSLVPNEYVYDVGLSVIAEHNFLYIAVLQSTIHEIWARTYSSSLETRMRYLNEDVFETFPFPQDLSIKLETEMERFGKKYHEFRRQLMLKMKLGLTKTYNQFHNPDLSEFSNEDIMAISALKAKEFQKQYGKETVNLWKHIEKAEGICTFNEAVHDILHLRQLHKQMYDTVLRAYGWEDINLAHYFYEVDYLPENDRVRYTISPDARKEVLKRLLNLNHEIHKQEVNTSLHVKGKTKKKKTDSSKQIKLF